MGQVWSDENVIPIKGTEENFVGIGIWNAWQCKECGHIQELVDDEEWPYHCDKTMDYSTFYGVKQFTTKPTHQ